MIEFDTEKPERLRGVKKSKAPINWEALDLVVQRSDGSPLQKQVMKRQFFKAIRENGIEALTPQFRYSYVVARISLGDFSDYFGWEFRDEWSARLFWEETWLPKWGGGEVNRLLVLGEQGLGDQIYWASILPEAMIRAKEVIYECDHRLHSILERSFKGLKCRAEREFEDRRPTYGPIDAFIPAGDLMRMFRRSRSHFPRKPFLKPDPKRVELFKRYTGKTGIAWRGRQGEIDPKKLEIDNPVNLQYKSADENCPVDTWGDIEGTLALVSVLGRVVTVPQTIHHISGGVGTRTEIIKSDIVGEVVNQIKWDHPNGVSPWYPNTEVFQSINEWRKSCSNSHKQS